MSALRQVCSRFQRTLTLGTARKSAATVHTNIFSQQPSAAPITATTRFQKPHQQQPFSSSPRPSDDFSEDAFSKMSNEELEDTSTIPGWDLIHSPPGKMPRGALVGTVVSTKMQKTINVAVDRYRIVPKVRKRMKYTRKFFAHDENEVANLGDMVMIEPCQRISKHKHFMLQKIVRPKGQL